MDRDRCSEVRRPQLPYWGSNNSSKMWPTRFIDKDAGEMGKHSLYSLYQNTKRDTVLGGRQPNLTSHDFFSYSFSHT